MDISNSISFSMYIDENQDCSISTDKTHCIDKIDKRNLYSWIKDDEVKNCYDCSIVFSFFNRKHHCRNCGRIFCNNCSNNKIEIPSDINQLSIDSNTISDYIFGTNKKVRVCNNCYEKILRYNELFKIKNIFYLCKLDIIQLNKLSLTSKRYYQCALNLKSSFRELQYIFDYDNFKENEKNKNLLWNNRKLLSGHNKLLVNLIHIIDHENIHRVNEVIKILQDDKKVSCWNLMCTRYCSDKFKIEDIISVLNYQNCNIKIRNIMINYISEIDIEIINNFLPVIVESMRYDNHPYPLATIIIDKSLESNKIIYNLYWELLVSIENKKYNYIYLELFNIFLEKIKKKLNNNTFNTLLIGQQLISVFNKVSILDQNYITNELENIKLNSSLFNKLTLLPNDPSYQIKNINITDIKICNSASKPIIIPFTCLKDSKEIKYDLLFKNENIKRDQIVMCAINLMKNILLKEENLDLFIKTYKITPTTNNSGIIEMIPDSCTLYYIKEKLKISILNFIIENNKTTPVDTVRDKFIKSTAAFSIITYLLGIGDRHLDNIMITKEGILFHIDFSFILGLDPKPLHPYIRITDEMIEAIGGFNSESYSEFKNICIKIYNCLRKHMNTFLQLFMIIPNINHEFNSEYKDILIKEFINKFAPGKTNDEAAIQLISHIESSYRSSNTIVDFFHYHSKEKTLTTTSNKIAENVYNLVGNSIGSIINIFKI